MSGIEPTVAHRRPLLLAFASAAERRRCAPPSLLASCSQAARLPVMPVQVGIAAARPGALDRAAPRACGLISCGIAGGLDPALPAGTLLLPERVLLEDGSALEVDLDWHRRALASLQGLRPLSTGALASSDVVVSHSGQKQALHAASAAVAVDMESGALAQWATSHRLPFLVLRVLLDPAAVALPAWSVAALRPDGSLALTALLGALLRQPASVLELPAMARQLADAAARWRLAITALGPALAPGAKAT